MTLTGKSCLTRREILSSANVPITNLTRNDSRSNSCLRGEKPSTNTNVPQSLHKDSVWDSQGTESRLYNENQMFIFVSRTGGCLRIIRNIQTRRSLVRFQMVSLEFFIDIIFPIALWPWGRLSL